MRKILIASHGRLAEGIISSLELLAGTSAGVTGINAYVEGSDIDAELAAFVQQLEESDQVFAFTDLYGGSVNQKVTKVFLENQVVATVIAGFNFPLLLEVLLAPADLSDEQLTEIVEKCRQEMTLTHLTEPVTVNDDDEFF